MFSLFPENFLNFFFVNKGRSKYDFWIAFTVDQIYSFIIIKDFDFDAKMWTQNQWKGRVFWKIYFESKHSKKLNLYSTVVRELEHTFKKIFTIH